MSRLLLWVTDVQSYWDLCKSLQTPLHQGPLGDSAEHTSHSRDQGAGILILQLPPLLPGGLTPQHVRLPRASRGHQRKPPGAESQVLESGKRGSSQHRGACDETPLPPASPLSPVAA